MRFTPLALAGVTLVGDAVVTCLARGLLDLLGLLLVSIENVSELKELN